MVNTWQISISTFSGAHWIIKFSFRLEKNKKKTSPIKVVEVHINCPLGWEILSLPASPETEILFLLGLIICRDILKWKETNQKKLLYLITLNGVQEIVWKTQIERDEQIDFIFLL